MPEILRSYKYDERRAMQAKKSFASPCTFNSDCTNGCCALVTYKQSYSYYGASTQYYGYATSYGVYTYRYSSYFPQYKSTYGIFLKNDRVCLNSQEAKDPKLCPIKALTTTYYTSSGSSAGGTVGGIVGLLCCCGIGVGIYFCCCKSKDAPQQTVVVV